MARKKKDKKAAKREARQAKKQARQDAKAARKEAKKQARQAKKAAKVEKKAARVQKKAARVVRKAPAGTVASAPVVRVHQDRRKPESLRLRSAGPSFTVADIHKSLDFYRDVLGFTPAERWEESGELTGIELKAGRVSFWLGQDDWKKGRDRVKGQGFRMYCTTTQDIDALAERVRAAGGTITEEPRDDPEMGRAFGLRDPDGFLITIGS